MASPIEDDASVIVRPARREDVAAIVRLLADDVLGAGRERVEEPVAPGAAVRRGGG